MSKKSEIQALIQLLDDEDENIISHVTQKLLSYGEEVIFNLESSWEKSLDSNVQERIENIVHQIQFITLVKAFKNWINQANPDLFDGAILVAKYQFPELDLSDTRIRIEGFKQKIWLELNNDLTPLETINVFNHVFYGLLSFEGNYSVQPDINDYCINHISESKKGSSISLGIMYTIIAQELNLPVYGVNLYRHFILSYQKKFIEDYNLDNSVGSLFYINPMNKGVVFERDEIKKYLVKMKSESNVKSFSAASNKEIIGELLYYLWFFFDSNNKDEEAEEINQLRELFE